MTDADSVQQSPNCARVTLLPARAGIAISLLFLLLGFVSILWTPYSAGSVDVLGVMQDPSGRHWLGTDQLGRDVLSLMMKGILTSFVVAAVAVAIGGFIGVPLGLGAALLGPYADLTLDGIAAYLMALPAFIVAALLAALFGPSAAALMVAIGIANIVPFALCTRQAVMGSSSRDYVAAARLAGVGGLELARRHMLTLIGKLVGAQAVTQLGFGIMTEAALSYVGLGVQPPAASLGALLHDAQAFLLTKPLVVVVLGLVLALIVASLNLTSAQLRRTAAAGLVSGDDGGAA